MSGAEVVLAASVDPRSLRWMPAECWGTHDREVWSADDRNSLKCRINAGRGRPRRKWQHCMLCNRRCRVKSRHRRLTIDHVVPISRGGCNHLHNLQLLCNDCNTAKGNALPWDLPVLTTRTRIEDYR